MSFKENLAGIVKEYQRQMTTFNEGIEAIRADRRFTDEGKDEAIKKIISLQKKLDEKANQSLAEEIAQFVSDYRPIEPVKDNDYELKVSNALKMIELLGNSLTDTTASQLLDFNMNSKQLGVFRTILESRYPSVLFNQTFKKLDDAEELLTAATHLQESAAGLFNHTNPYGLSDLRISDIEYYANIINPPAEGEVTE